MSARDRMLASLRAGLRGTSVPPLPAPLPPPPGDVSARAERFAEALAMTGGQVDRVVSLAAARRRVHELLAAANARTVAASDAPEVAELLAAPPDGVHVLRADAPRGELLRADAGVTGAQWAIAETGTLVLLSAEERHRLASLLPPLHVAVVHAARLLGTLHDAFAALRGPDGAPCARTITFVTGPSRTADIELELVVGVHGPRQLHVLLVDAP